MTFRYFIHLAYNGTNYGGWQIQPNAITVQELVEKGLRYIADIESGVVGCGRTDKGVHATNFYAHFENSKDYNCTELTEIVEKLNRFLPHDIAIYNIQKVATGAHARFSAISRSYEYIIITAKDPFLFEKSYFHYNCLDVNEMNECCKLLLGEHNFKCFSKSRTQVNNYNCSVLEAQWSKDNHVLKLHITANRFLRNMVRAIVGTLIEVGERKITLADFKTILASENRNNAGLSVPAQGLKLTKVEYPKDIFMI